MKKSEIPFDIIHGVDLVEIDRFSKATRRWGDRFLNRIFTPSEINHSKSRHSPAVSLASHFAAKEAVVKALGVKILGWGYGAIKWHEIEILHDTEGKPLVCLHGKAEQLSNEMGLKALSLSLSDTNTHALASVIGLVRGSNEDC